MSQDKLIIIGWDERAERVIQEVHAEVARPEMPVLVLSEGVVDTAPYSRDPRYQNVTWLSADLNDTNTLYELQIHESSCIILLANQDAQEPDGVSALRLLALRRAMNLASQRGTLKPDDQTPHIVVECINAQQKSLLMTAGADEVICSSDYGLGILAQAAFTYNISDVYSDLLSFSEFSNEIYSLRTPPVGQAFNEQLHDLDEEAWQMIFEGKSFAEATIELMTLDHLDPRNPFILIGLRRLNPETGLHDVLLNPQSAKVKLNLESGTPQAHEFDRFKRGDEPIVIAFWRPKLRYAEHRAANAEG